MICALYNIPRLITIPILTLLALPLLVVVMLIICPVFFYLEEMRMVQYIFPPTYYINAITSNRYLLLMVAYALVLLMVYYLLGKVLRRR